MGREQDERAAEEQARMIDDTKGTGVDAYCRNCGYICAARVTYSETCDQCHIPVEWHDAQQQDTIAALREKVAELEGSDGSLRNYLASIGETLRPTSLPVGRIIQRHNELIDRATAAEARVKVLEEALEKIASAPRADNRPSIVVIELHEQIARKALAGGEGG